MNIFVVLFFNMGKIQLHNIQGKNNGNGIFDGLFFNQIYKFTTGLAKTNDQTFDFFFFISDRESECMCTLIKICCIYGGSVFNIGDRVNVDNKKLWF